MIHIEDPQGLFNGVDAPTYPDIFNGTGNYFTRVRVQRKSDGVWFLVMLVSDYYIHERTGNGYTLKDSDKVKREIEECMSRMMKDAYIMQRYYAIPSDEILMQEMYQGSIVRDPDQRTEEDRLVDQYPHTFPKKSG